MNIYDISQKAGVSIATVSRVLNGSEKVSEKHGKGYLLLWKKTAIPPMHCKQAPRFEPHAHCRHPLFRLL